MRVKIACIDGERWKFDAVDIVGTPFAATRFQDTTHWVLTHKPSGYGTRPYAWTNRDALVRAAYEWWAALPEAIQVLYTHGTFYQIVKYGGAFAKLIDGTADVELIDEEPS